MIKIEGTFFVHPNIRPSILANEYCSTDPGMRVRLAGWGYNELQVLPQELHEIEQYIVDNETCYEEWGGDITSRYEVNTFSSKFHL